MIVWTISDLLTVGSLVLGAITMLVCIAFAYLHDYSTKLFCSHKHGTVWGAHNDLHCRKCGKIVGQKGGQNG